MTNNPTSPELGLESPRAKCFVIQPYGVRTNSATGEDVDNDKVFSALQRLENIDPTFPIEIIRGDIRPVRRESLNSHLSDCFDEAHFCIADVTGQNPNVFYEIGYARGKGLKVIIICQDRQDVPSDLEGSLVIQYKPSKMTDLVSEIRHHFGRVKDDISNLIGRRIEDAVIKVPYLPKRDDQLIRKK